MTHLHGRRMFTSGGKQSYPNSLSKLARQPHTLKEALDWTRWLLMHGHTVSIGLMQVNSELASHLGIADLGLLFDPCINLAAGTLILQESFRGQPATLDGLARTFALYNAGSPNWTTALSCAAQVIV